jgi:hypothetical protein
MMTSRQLGFKPGLGHIIAQAFAHAKINLDFFVAQVIGRRYSAVIGFENNDDAKRLPPSSRKRRSANADESASSLAADHEFP